MYRWKEGEYHAHSLQENLEFHEYSINVNFMDVRRTEDSIFLRTELNIVSPCNKLRNLLLFVAARRLDGTSSFSILIPILKSSTGKNSWIANIVHVASLLRKG